MELIKKIRELGYTFKKRNKYNDDWQYNIVTPAGDEFNVPCDRHRILLAPGTADETAITGEDFYKEVYSEEDYCTIVHKCSLDTGRYLENIMKNAGLTGMELSNDFRPFPEEELLYTLDNPDPSASLISVYPCGSGYAAAFTGRDSSTSHMEYRLYFDHRPAQWDFNDAMLVHKIQIDLMRGHFRETFICRGCGELTNWLDIKGPLEEKYEKAVDHFCGKC